jgi:lipoate---protein ligase
MDDWRVLPFETADAPALLERGAALLDGLADEPVPTLRWYRSATPAVVLGRGQGDLGAVAPGGDLTVVTRYSGGGAVLMDSDLLSLDVLVPAGHPWLDGGPGAIFGPVGRSWATALRTLGVPDVAVHSGAAQARRRGDARERLLAAVCYATLGRGEVTTGGRKIVGLAQRRRRPGALVQCGLLRRWRPARLLAALGADPDDPAVAAAAAGLDEVVAHPPSDAQLMHAVGCNLRRHG